jgi:hypothetical protein
VSTIRVFVVDNALWYAVVCMHSWACLMTSR